MREWSSRRNPTIDVTGFGWRQGGLALEPQPFGPLARAPLRRYLYAGECLFDRAQFVGPAVAALKQHVVLPAFCATVVGAVRDRGGG
jgi:hypothetical protein